MTQYVDSEYRQVDGGAAQYFWQPVPFTSMRQTTSNDISGTTAIGAAGSPGVAITTLLHKHSLPVLEYTSGDSDSALRIHWASSDVVPVVFQVPLPPHLDPSTDLTIGLYAAMSSTSDTIALDADTYFDSGDSKLSDASSDIGGTAPANYSITIASGDIPIGARTMTVELTPESHGSDALYLYSCWVEGKYIP